MEKKFAEISNEFNNVHDVHMFFYFWKNSKLNVYMIKEESRDSFHDISMKVETLDHMPIFAIAKKLANYLGIFNPELIRKIKLGKQLAEEDLERTNLEWFTIWNNLNFTYWRTELTKPIIQYDSIKDKIIYFKEIDELNVDFWNSQIKKLGLNFEVKIHEYGSNLDGISKNTTDLLNHFDFFSHVTDSENNLRLGNVDHYILLTIKKPCDTTDPENYYALFQSIFKKNNEYWHCYDAKERLPSFDIVQKAKSILLPGSEMSAYEEINFNFQAVEWIKQVTEKFPNKKILGLCYGHQIVNLALGGQVRKRNGEVIYKEEKVNFDKKFWEVDFVKNSKIQKQDSFYLLELHGDEVFTINNEIFENYATSETADIELCINKNRNILTTQFHCEYSSHHFFIKRIKVYENLLKLNYEITNEENAFKALDDYHTKLGYDYSISQTYKNDENQMLRILFYFFKIYEVK